jgi:hypothetical protein
MLKSDVSTARDLRSKHGEGGRAYITFGDVGVRSLNYIMIL